MVFEIDYGIMVFEIDYGNCEKPSIIINIIINCGLNTLKKHVKCFQLRQPPREPACKTQRSSRQHPAAQLVDTGDSADKPVGRGPPEWSE